MGTNRMCALLVLMAATSACEDSKSNDAPSPVAATVSDPSGGTTPSQGDVVITGQVAIDSLPADIVGSALSVQGQEVQVLSAEGAPLAKAVTTEAGSYAVIVPGKLAAGGSALALVEGGLTLQSVVSKTANDAVVGFKLPVPKDGSSAVTMGKTSYEKITAVRGRAQLETGGDSTGIVVYVPGTSFQARTDAAGLFLMTFIPAGSYDLTFEKDGYSSASLNGVLVSEGETTITEAQVLKLSGGVSSISVKQRGRAGYSGSRSVVFDISAGGADRFKAGTADELEAKAYGPVASVYTQEFTADGTYVVRLIFANADGFETTVDRAVIVDTVAPNTSGMQLVDRKTLNSSYTNERYVLAYHTTCDDIDTVAILPTSTVAPAASDFQYECFTAGSSDAVSFTIPTGVTSHAYKIWAMDRVGNVSASAASGTIQYDGVAPTVPQITIADQTSNSTIATDITTVDVTLASCVDVQSVIISESQLLPPRASQFQVACSTAADAFQYTFANNIPGTKTLLVWAMDAAGNVAQVSRTADILLDTVRPTAPTFSLADPTPILGGGQSNSLTLAVTLANCTDVDKVLISETASTSPTESTAGWQTCTTGSGVTATALGEGSRTFYLWAKDVAGNLSTTAQTASIAINTASPTFTLADPTPANAGYSNTSTLAATPSHCDDITHVIISESQSSQPSLASGDWVPCSTSGLSITAGGDGYRTFYLWAKYQGGYVAASASTGAITVDSTPPVAPTLTLSDATNGSTDYVNAVLTNVAISSCGDADKVYLSESATAPAFGDFSTACATSGITLSLANTTNETKTVRLWVRDLAGNISSAAATDTIEMDTVAPALPASIALADTTSTSTTYTNGVTIDYTLSDCPSGAYVLVRESQSTAPAEGDGGWSVCSTTGQTTITSGGQGVKTFWLWSRDAAGNVSASSITSNITYDTVAATVPSMTLQDEDDDADAGYANTQNIDVTLSTCTDIAAIYLSASATTPSEAAISTACNTSADGYTVPISAGAGAKSIYLWVKDAAGNVSSTTGSIHFDATTPTISALYVTGVSGDSIAMTWTTSESVPTKIEWGTSTGVYANQPAGAGNATSHSTSVTGLANGTKIFFRVIARDANGNTATSSEVTARTVKAYRAFGSADNMELGLNGSFGSTDITKRQLVACDINDDGLDDAVFSNAKADEGGRTDNGAVYVVYGNASPAATYAISGEANLLFYGESANRYLGRSLLCTDFNGDGKDDLILVDGATTSYAYLVLGSSSFPATPTSYDMASAGNYSVRFTAPGSKAYGNATGRINNDSYGDLVLCGSSSCYGFFGAATPDNGTDFTLDMDSTFGTYGRHVAIGDVDGDNLDDIVVGAETSAGHDGTVSTAGAAIITKGGALTGTISSADYQVHGTSGSSGYLNKVAVGDIDNDGFDDILLRRTNDNSGFPWYIIFGRNAAAWTALSPSTKYLVASTNLRFEAVTTGGSNSYYNQGSITLADVNGDSALDVVISDTLEDKSGGSDNGRVCVFKSRSQAEWTALAASNQIALTKANYCLDGADDSDFLGVSLAVGQFDGSGPADVFVAAYGADGVSDGGSLAGEIVIFPFEWPSSTNPTAAPVTDLAPFF